MTGSISCSPRAAARAFIVVALVLSGAPGCAPTERYTTDKTPEPPPTAAGPSPCRMGTPVTRLQSRSSNQRSVEGFNSFPCAPSPKNPASP